VYSIFRIPIICRPIILTNIPKIKELVRYPTISLKGSWFENSFAIPNPDNVKINTNVENPKI